MSLDSSATDLTTVSALIAQVLDGTTLGVRERAECRRCRASLRDGSPAAVRAHRMNDEARWSDDSLLCMDCLSDCGTIEPTPDIEEVLVLGRLVTRADAARQSAQLAFRAGEDRDAVLDYLAASDWLQLVLQIDADVSSADSPTCRFRDQELSRPGSSKNVAPQQRLDWSALGQRRQPVRKQSRSRFAFDALGEEKG